MPPASAVLPARRLRPGWPPRIPALILRWDLPAGLATLTPAGAALGPAKAAATTTRPATVRFRPGFVDIQRPSFQRGSIESGDGAVGFRGIVHFHKCEAAGTSCVAICNHIDSLHTAVLFEQCTNGTF